MKLTRDQTGVAHLLGILAVVLLVGIGVVGWRVWQSQKKPVTVKPKPVVTQEFIVTKDGMTTYKNTRQGFSIVYPQTWGDATLVGMPSDFKEEDQQYKALTFSKEPKVSINFVTSPFVGGRDGPECSSPLAWSQVGLQTVRASIIGWKGAQIRNGDMYMTDTGQLSFTESLRDLSVYQQKLIRTTDKVMAYEEADQTAVPANPDCGFSQADADEATTYKRIVYFAVNFTTSTVKGVNAQYFADSPRDQKVIDTITTALNSIQKL